MTFRCHFGVYELPMVVLHDPEHRGQLSGLLVVGSLAWSSPGDPERYVGAGLREDMDVIDYPTWNRCLLSMPSFSTSQGLHPCRPQGADGKGKHGCGYSSQIQPRMKVMGKEGQGWKGAKVQRQMGGDDWEEHCH